jgi:hypothetical protein
MRQVAVGLALIGLSLPHASAVAAVRKCAGPIAGTALSQPSEVAAKRAALTAWTLKAADLGLGYTRWELSDKRALKCVTTPKSASTFDCVAAASPCIIVQNPNVPGERKPAAPSKKGKYKKRGAPIDT